MAISGSDIDTKGERPTLKTIAFMTGLGVTTVSRALKDAPDIGADTKERVRLVAKQIGYRPNRAGVRLRTGKTNVIALILNTHEEIMGFSSQIIYGISEVLAQTPYHLVVTPYSHSADPMEPVRYVVETGSADGVIISRTEPNDPRVRYLMEHDFPFVTHGRTDMGVAHPYHDFDNHAFARKCVEALAAKGRRRLALLPPTPDLTYFRHMTSGFSEAVRELGLDEVSLPGIHIDLSLAEIKIAMTKALSGRHRPDGIICGSSGAVIAVVAAIDELGLKLGTDIDVYSKQSMNILPWFRKEIGVFNEDVRAAGRELARAVIGHIDGKPAETLQSIYVLD